VLVTVTLTAIGPSSLAATLMLLGGSVLALLVAARHQAIRSSYASAYSTVTAPPFAQPETR